MSKFTVKIFSNDRVDLYGCNSVSVAKRTVSMSQQDVAYACDCQSIVVRMDEASYIENASGKTVYSLPQINDSSETPVEKPTPKEVSGPIRI